MEFPCLPEHCSRYIENQFGGRSTSWLCAFVVLCLITITPAHANLPYEPRVSLTKSVDDIRDNDDGTFSVTFSFVAANSGTETLLKLAVDDALDFIDASQIVSVGAIEVVAGALSTNPDYDGVNDSSLLIGTDQLAVGAEASFRFEFRFDADGDPGPYTNTATVWAKGKHSGRGVDGYADAQFSLPLVPDADFAKTIDAVTNNGDGTYSALVTLDAHNVGAEELVQFQFKDDLTIFGTGALVSVANAEVLDGALTLNPAFDGISDTRLLEGHDTLPPGGRARLRFSITFDPASEPGPFNNCALIWTEGKYSGTAVDFYDCAEINIPLVPEAEFEKTISDVVANGDETYSAMVTLDAVNVGNEKLARLQFKDDLDIFGAGQLIDVSDVEVLDGALTLNPAFDGINDIRLLEGTDFLPRGERVRLRFSITFDPASEPGPFSNCALIWSEGKYSGTAVDFYDCAEIALPPKPLININKEAGQVSVENDGNFTVPVTLTVTNSGTEALVNLQIIDDLDIFGAGQLVAIEGVASPTLSLNPNYDGIADAELLAGTDGLPRGVAATVSFVLRFNPGPEPGPFVNVATANATGGISADPVTDSDDASFLAIPTEPNPAIAVEKTAASVADNGDGSFSVPISISVTNTGNEALAVLQLEDSLDIFGSGQLLAVENVTSPTLSVNPNFDGLADTALLTGTDGLPLATAASITFTIRFDPGSEPGPFTNVVTASASGDPSGDSVTDSDDALFLATPTEPNPAIEVKKAAGEVSAAADGNFTVPITITVTNVGNEALGSVQIVDSLDIFGAGQLIAVENLAGAGLSVNPAYDGLADSSLLSGDDDLALAGTGTLTFVLRFNPGPEAGPFQNIADASAIGGISGDPVTDSDDASFLAIPTEPNPAIAIEKTAGSVVDNGDGSFSVPISISVTNTGNEALVALRLEDSLDIFGNGQLVAVEDIASPTLSINPNYDGLADTSLLTGNDGLSLATAASITFKIRFDPGSEPGPFTNIATATANGDASGDLVSDSSDASFLATPTEPNPAIDVNKVAGEVSAAADGNFTVPITITVTNVGNESLGNIQIIDSLDIFGAGQLVAVENLTSPTLSTNASYDGLGNTNLLSGNDDLALAGIGTITFVLRFNPGPEAGPFINIATASATGGISGDPVTDSDDASFLAIPTEPNPAIDVQKLVGAVVDNGDGTFLVPINISVTNTGNEALVALQLEDSLDIFGNGQLVAVEDIASPTLSVNPNYDGLTDTALLTGNDALPLATLATLSFLLRFDPGPEAGPFTNIVNANAIGETSGDPVSDSDDASFLATPAQPNPAIDVNKVAGEVSAAADGNFTVPITITVTNVGNESLGNTQITDSLDIFGAGQLIAVENLASSTLTVNAAYDGLVDTNLLSGSDALAFAGTGTLTFVVRFDPGPEAGPFVNVATASATGSSSGDPVEDSDDASFLAMPTEPNPAIAVEKTAGVVVDNGDSSFSVPMTITVTNTGNEQLNALQLEDSLDIFGSGRLIAVENLVSDTLSVNPDYDGLSNINLLDGSDSLDLAAAGTLTFRVRFDPAFEPGPIVNTVMANAVSADTAVVVTDSSDASFNLLEPPSPGADAISVSKRADRRQVMRGENVAYEIAVTNLTANLITGVEITDQPPFGFRFVEDSAVLIRAGADEIVYTADDIVMPIAASGSSPIVFEPFDLGPHERIVVRYLMRVSVGVANGEYVNQVTVSPDPFSPVTSAAPVTVFGDPIFEQSTLIGKVFYDRDKNGNQDENEPGVPGVRLATVGGLTVETDAEGRYHLADVSVARFDRGANFIIKLDEASLPAGSDVLSQNPRVIRLTQATMSKVNFAVSLPGSSRDTTEPQPCEGEATNELFPGGRADASDLNCAGAADDPPNKATATHIKLSGGQFGCKWLAAETLPGRMSNEHSEVTVYAGKVKGELPYGHVCVQATEKWDAITVGGPTLELTTMNGTELRINSVGDVIRKQDPDNDEHIIVTPFRDESDNTVISALRVINDGQAPDDENTQRVSLPEPGSGVAVGESDPLIVDPRLDVLAMHREIVDDSDDPVWRVKFAIYTNYPNFIEAYRLRVFGRVANKPGRWPLLDQVFSDYRFDKRWAFEGKVHDLSKYDELEYFLEASNCAFDKAVKDCFVDTTTARTLALSGNAAADLHDENELWGQSSLSDQRIPIQGSRVRTVGEVKPWTAFVIEKGFYVPVAKNGTYVLEEHLRTQPKKETDVAASAAKPPMRPISADATKIRVLGGLFGCDLDEIESLPGRAKNQGMTIQAATVAADPNMGNRAPKVCNSTPAKSRCGFALQPGEIEVSTEEGSCFLITATGDVIADDHPDPEDNRQQLVITPFRDETDSTTVSALRIANEGSPGAVPVDIGTTVVTSDAPADDYWFTVAIANLTVGQNDVSGNKDLLSEDKHFDGSTYTDGRVAFYTKGRIDEKYLITAQLDSTEDELKNFGDNLQRKDRRRIFRQLDPNRYFPTYGDDSITTTDVDSQGAFYARVDWDKSQALWGNYNTGLTDTEFMQYNRSLYGLKLRHEDLETTEFGNSKSKLTLFGSEAQSAAAHVTFRATGGSLYYLRDTDIVQGSEKVWVEVRRRDTEQVVERTIFLAGRDYEIDAVQGRIILRRPLSQVVNDRERSIIRSTPLEGDEVYLLVDYEYVPEAFTADSLTVGGRGQIWLGDHVAIGANSVADERDNTDYALQGFDLTLQHSESSYLRAEFAESRARQNNANFASANGGLSFNTQTSMASGDALDGNATALEARLDFADLGDVLVGDLQAWSKSRDAEFSTGRLGQGVDVNDRGFELHAGVGDQFELTVAYTDLELEGVSRQRVSRAQADGNFGELEVGVEVRQEKVERQSGTVVTPDSILNGTTIEGEALLVGARVAYSLSTKSSVYASGQTVADDKGVYQENDLFTLGMNTKLREDLGISLEASDGDRGSAMIAGVDYAADNGLNFNVSGGVGSGAINQFATRYAIGDGHELYGSYAIDPDRTDASRNLLTLGQRRSFGNGVGLFTESQFGKDDRYASVGHVFGLDFEGHDDWRLNASMQLSENEGLGQVFDRSVLSLGAYRNASQKNGNLKLSTRIEYREDQGSSLHQRQYVSTSSFNKVLENDRRWLGQLNASWTDDLLNGGHDAKFVELDLGYAVRPAANDKYNLIGRYSFLFDLPTEGQATIRPDERSHLLSLEGIYDPENRWEFAAKVAIRKGERRSMRDMGPWQDFGLRMSSIRARYQVSKSWDGVAEYRWLSDIDGDNERHGALLALYRQVGDNFKVGVGFNFAGFSDNLKVDDYDNRGWFVDLVGMY